jgi:hypothetical protein
LKVATSASVRAAREQCDQDGQVPRREQQLFGLGSSRLGRTRDEAQAMTLHKIAQVLDTDSGEIHDLCMSEYFLASSHGNHGFVSP